MSECERDGTGRVRCVMQHHDVTQMQRLWRVVVYTAIDPVTQTRAIIVLDQPLVAGDMFSTSRDRIVVQHAGHTKPRARR
jgi:hypothetical protein